MSCGLCGVLRRIVKESHLAKDTEPENCSTELNLPQRAKTRGHFGGMCGNE